MSRFLQAQEGREGAAAEGTAWAEGQRPEVPADRRAPMAAAGRASALPAHRWKDGVP